MQNPFVSVIDNNLDTNPASDNPLSYFLQGIKADFKPLLVPVRQSLSDEKKYKELKNQLPAIQFCGVFKDGRTLKHLQKYNNLICLDIDHLDNAERIKGLIQVESFIQAVFVSPSLKGLKIIVPFMDNADVDKWNAELSGESRNEALSALKEYHATQFVDLERYFEGKYNLDLDKSGKDITRLCYVSYDENIVVNNSVVPRPIALRIVPSTKVETNKSNHTATANHSPNNAKTITATANEDKNKCDEWTLGQTAWHLKIIPSDDYLIWRNVGFALHNHFNGSDVAFNVFVEWSKTSQKFVSTENCKTVIWTSQKDGGITIKTIANYHNEYCAKYYKSIAEDFDDRKHELYDLFISKVDTMYLSKKRDGYKASNKSEIKEDLINYLLERGVTAWKMEIDRIIRNLYLVSDVYSTCSCFTAGIHNFNGLKYLIERSPQMIKPIQGDWSNLKYMLETTLPAKDKEWLYTRLAIDLKAFLARDITSKGQLLMFIGDIRTGKTTLQKLIARFYGGTSADVNGYITGAKTFNKEMLLSPYWVIDDTFQRPVNVQIPLFKEKLTEFIKLATVKSPLAFEAKHLHPVTLSDMFRRAIFTLNEKNEILQLLPDASDIDDKYSLLYFNHSFDGAKFDDGVYDQELPHFAYYLLNEWVKPDWIELDVRQTIQSYKNDTLKKKIFEASNEATILGEIETILKAAGMDEIKGTANEIFDDLNKSIKNTGIESTLRHGRFVRLAKNGFGHTLKRLKNHCPNNVTSRTLDGYNIWTIKLTKEENW